MPNRILREGILTSERVNNLGPAAELFYRRLMSVVDDYGRFDARPTLLRVSCYPLKIDSIREADISRSLAEAQSAGLIALYEVDGKPYLQMLDFRQQTRAKHSKYPHPPPGCVADATHVHSTCIADAYVYGDGDGDDKALSPRTRGDLPGDSPEKPPPAVTTPTKEAVREAAQRLSIPQDIADMFFDSAESRPLTPQGGWTRHNGQPMAMDRWQHALAAFAASVHRNQRSSGVNHKPKTKGQSKYANAF